jgi:dolichol-phosphate mannosyltransferase
VSFSRNFGHQRAITAGMESARGKAVVVMDADLQDPPEVVVEMLAKWREGYDVVYGRRRTRAGETAFKLFTAKIFYRLFAAMIPIEVPLDTGDFRLISRRVIVAMNELRETHRFVRGLVAWVGFKQTAVEYDRAARFAGETKYPLRKMLAFAFDGIASFSILPLRLATYLGVLVGIASVLYGISAIYAYFVLHDVVQGWTTTVTLVAFLFSVQLLVTGVLGEYVGRIYEQVKQRPLYVVGERLRHSSMRKRLSTKDFTPAVDPARTTKRPPAGAPPPASGAAPAPARALLGASEPSRDAVLSEAIPASQPPSFPGSATPSAPPPLPARASVKPGPSNPPSSPPPRPSTRIPAVEPTSTTERPPPPSLEAPSASASSPPPSGTRPPPPLPSAATKKSDTPPKP